MRAPTFFLLNKPTDLTDKSVTGLRLSPPPTLYPSPPSSLHMKEARLDIPLVSPLSRSDACDLGIHFFVFGGGVLVTFELVGVLLANTYRAAQRTNSTKCYLSVEVVVVKGQHHAPRHLR